MSKVFCWSKGSFGLRATLRAATHLEAKYGFAGLLGAVADGNLGIIGDVIDASSDCPDFLKSIEGVPLARFMPELLPALNRHIQALAGIDPDNHEPERGSGESMPFKEYYARLYRIGTGWLGWSPETTWNATAKEITEAYSGNLEMLKAIYGSADDQDQQRPTDKPDEAVFDRAGLNALRGMGKAYMGTYMGKAY